MPLPTSPSSSTPPAASTAPSTSSKAGQVRLRRMPAAHPREVPDPGFCYVDGRFMYPALCRELGVGERMLTAHQPGRRRAGRSLPRQEVHRALMPADRSMAAPHPPGMIDMATTAWATRSRSPSVKSRPGQKLGD